MADLIGKALYMSVPQKDKDEKWDAKMYFIEELTFSSQQEIQALLTYFRENTKAQLPHWAQGLAHRLLCLLDPANSQSCHYATLYCTTLARGENVQQTADGAVVDRLIVAGNDLLYNPDPNQEWVVASIHLVEVLSCSNSSAIKKFLDYFLTKDWLALPPWLRNLAFRLVCLWEPKNAAIRREAALDIRPFVDWDHIADTLEKEAAMIERVDNP